MRGDMVDGFAMCQFTLTPLSLSHVAGEGEGVRAIGLRSRLGNCSPAFQGRPHRPAARDEGWFATQAGQPQPDTSDGA